MPGRDGTCQVVTRVASAGVVDTCLNDLTILLDMTAAFCIGPVFPVSSLECDHETRFGLVEKGGNFTLKQVCEDN